MRFGKHEERTRNFECPQCKKDFARSKDFNRYKLKKKV